MFLLIILIIYICINIDRSYSLRNWTAKEKKSNKNETIYRISRQLPSTRPESVNGRHPEQTH